MKKIFIVGIVASGKTTLAKKLSEKLNIPWYELDCVVHHQTDAGRYKRTPEEQAEVIAEIDKAGSWIFEGTLRESYKYLLDMADTIIFLDPPLWKRKFRIFFRFTKQQLGIEKCHYKSDIKMLKKMFEWTHNFERDRDNFEALLRLYSHKLIRLAENNDLSFTKQV